MLVPPWHYLDICTTTVLTGLWVLYLECLSDTHCNLSVRQSNEHIKHHLFFFVWYKFFCHHPFQVVTNKRETENKNKLTTLLRQRETATEWCRQTQTLVLSFLFAAVVPQVLRWLLQNKLAALWSSPKNSCCNFLPIFTSLWLVPN